MVLIIRHSRKCAEAKLKDSNNPLEDGDDPLLVSEANLDSNIMVEADRIYSKCAACSALGDDIVCCMWCLPLTFMQRERYLG